MELRVDDGARTKVALKKYELLRSPDRGHGTYRASPRVVGKSGAVGHRGRESE